MVFIPHVPRDADGGKGPCCAKSRFLAMAAGLGVAAFLGVLAFYGKEKAGAPGAEGGPPSDGIPLVLVGLAVAVVPLAIGLVLMLRQKVER